jgi:hypothetical protein
MRSSMLPLARRLPPLRARACPLPPPSVAGFACPRTRAACFVSSQAASNRAAALLSKHMQALRDAGVPDAATSAKVLLAAALGHPAPSVGAADDSLVRGVRLNSAQAATFTQLCGRRAKV